MHCITVLLVQADGPLVDMGTADPAGVHCTNFPDPMPTLQPPDTHVAVSRCMREGSPPSARCCRTLGLNWSWRTDCHFRYSIA